MAVSYSQALEMARGKCPHEITNYEVYLDYFVFWHDGGAEHVGGSESPVVIRKSDGAALDYMPMFFGLGEEDVGDVISEGWV